MYRVSKDSRVYRKEYEMNLYKANDIEEALRLKVKYPDATLFAGGSDVVVALQKDTITDLIDISHLSSLNFIKEDNHKIEIGALTTINTLLQNDEIKKHLPLLNQVAQTFASHQIRNIATLGGNIINDSPVADFIAPLIVLGTTVKLVSLQGERVIPLEQLFDGYKSLTLENEILISFEIPIQEGKFYYRKVGARKQLNIAKLSLCLFYSDNKYKLSGASLNPYTKRFLHIEKILENENFTQDELIIAIQKDISPHSNKDYKQKVLLNLINEALEAL